MTNMPSVDFSSTKAAIIVDYGGPNNDGQPYYPYFRTGKKQVFMRIVQFLFFVFCISVGVSLHAQNNRLEVQSGTWGGLKYLNFGQPIKSFIVLDAAEVYPEAMFHIDRGRSKVVIGDVLSIPGSVVLGYGLGGLLVGRRISSAAWIVSGSATLIGLLMNHNGKRDIQKGLNILNRTPALKSLSVKEQYQIEFVGSGIVMSF